MQYSISTAITTILFASTLTTAIPVVQKPGNSTDTKVTVEFTGAHEKAIQDDILANGKPQPVSKDVQGVTDAEVLIANGLNNVKCLAFDAQGMQISNAFALNQKAPLGGPAQNKGGVDVAKVMCSTSVIATAPSGTSSSIPRATPLGTVTSHDGEHLSKRAEAASSSAAAGPTGAAGSKDSGKNANSLDAPSATSDSSSSSPTNPAANKNNGAGDKNRGASGSKASEQGPEMTSMPSMSHNGTKSSGAGMHDGNGDAPLVRLAFSGLPDLERQQPIPADGANHNILGAVNITEVSIMDAHGQSGVKCQAFNHKGRIGQAFSEKNKAQFNNKHGVNIKKVACDVDDDASASASASGTNPGGPIMTDPMEPRLTPIPQASGKGKGKTDSIETAPGPEQTGPFATGKGKDASSSIASGPGPEETGPFATGKNKGSSDSSSSIMTSPGPEKTGPFKSMGAMSTMHTVAMDGGNAKPTSSA